MLVLLLLHPAQYNQIKFLIGIHKPRKMERTT